MKRNTGLLFLKEPNASSGNSSKDIKNSSESWPLNFLPFAANTLYTYLHNKIIIPMGIMLPPFYSEDQPMAMNYGQLGAIIGHEVHLLCSCQFFKVLKMVVSSGG